MSPTSALKPPGKGARGRSRSRLLDTRALAAAGMCLTGDISLHGMPRLREAAGVKQHTHARADYELSFSRDSQGQCRIMLCLEVGLTLVCQRCLDPMRLDLKRRLVFGVVSSVAEAKRLPVDCEPVEADAAGYIDLVTLIEEEILLSIPFAPKHPEGYC